MVPLVVFAVLFAVLAKDQSSAALEVEPITLKKVVTSYGAALRHRDFRWAWIAKVVLWIGYGISTMYSLYMLQSYIKPVLGADAAATTAPLIQLAAIPGTLLAMLVAGRWSDRIGRRKPFVIAGSLLMAVSFLVPFAWAALPAMFIQAIISGVGFGAYLVVDQALFIDVLPDKTGAAGRDLGMSALGQNLGQAVGPVLAGTVVGFAGGNYGPVWPVAFAIVLAAAAAIIPIKSVR
jgi:MFS family permease